MIRVAGYPIDCALEERLSYEADITENAVEKGVDFADHIHRKQPVLEFEGIVTDTPIGAVAIDSTRTELAGDKASADAYRRFVEIFEADPPLPVTVECSYGTFENMGLERLTPTRDSQTARAFRFTAVFRKIRILTNKRVTVLVPRAAKKQNGGHLTPRTESEWFGVPATVPYVISRGPNDRWTYARTYGPPLLTTTYAERKANKAEDPKKVGTLDHYRVPDTVKPDGWIQDSKYFRLGKGVTYNDAEKSWERGGKRLTRQPPPEADDDDSWFGISRGKQ